MIKILTVVGARPQIIKAAALSRAIKNSFSNSIKEYILHTGQHYDENMSQVFFDELEIPQPDFNLNVGSAMHGVQTAKMIEGIESVLLDLKPDYLVVYGDTNSTLAGAIAASKLHIPIVHIEAGLRSFNKNMPEEINRILCDHTSTMLFSPTESGIQNLVNEGFDLNSRQPWTMNNPAVFHCGDVMFDNSLHFAEIAEKQSEVLKNNNLTPGNYVLVTIHRNNNTDDPERLNNIFGALIRMALDHNQVFFLPIHPRTSKMLKSNLRPELLHSLSQTSHFKITEPVSFLDMIMLEKNSRMVITDSGGVQKEAYFFEKPCIILRPQTEWVEILENGAATISDADKEKIIKSFNLYLHESNLVFKPIFGDGKAAEFICRKIIENV